MAGQYESDPWQKDYDRQKSAGFPRQPAAVPGYTSRHAQPTKNDQRTALKVGIGPILLALGVLLWVIALVLNAVKVDGFSAAYVNGECQSSLGQFGQALSGAFGDTAPTHWCSEASNVETWKGILFWLGLAVLLTGTTRLGRTLGWIKPSRRQLQRKILENQLAQQRARSAPPRAQAPERPPAGHSDSAPRSTTW